MFVHVVFWIVCLLFQPGPCLGHGVARNKRSGDLGATDAVLAALTQKISLLEAENQAMKNNIQTTNQELKTQLNTVQSAQGSTFVRWGRTTCTPDSSLIYSGVAGGAHYSHTGGGTNRLCLTFQPVVDNTPLDPYFGTLEGAHYFLPGHHYTDVVCVVCHTSHAATFMVPGTNRCPAGSVEQYHGYLTSGDHTHRQGSEYLCMDNSPEDRPGSQRDENSGYFEHVRAHCGSLPCPPYVENKVVTCVVCSM